MHGHTDSKMYICYFVKEFMSILMISGYNIPVNTDMTKVNHSFTPLTRIQDLDQDAIESGKCQ